MTVLARLRHPALRGVWIGLACALISWLAVQWSLLRGLEDWMLDGCFSLRGRRPTTARIVIIGLDAPSLAEMKKPITSLSPELAEVIVDVKEQGAKAIGVDVLLPADREDLPALQLGEEGDALKMGQAVAKTGIVTLPVWRLGDKDWLLPVRHWRYKADHDRETADLAFVNWQEDSDQFVRRQQLLGKDGNRLLPQMALALYARMRGQDINVDDAGRPLVGGELIPVDAEGKVRINSIGVFSVPCMIEVVAIIPLLQGGAAMSLTVDAVYENGCLKLAQPLPLQEHEKVRVTVHPPVSRARQTAGLMGWRGGAEEAERFALDPELDFPPPPEEP